VNWSDEEVRALGSMPEGEPLTTPETLAIATRAVEIVAVRGGTMTVEALAEMERKSGLSTYDCKEAFDHLRVQGARVAMLEAERDELRAQADAIGKNWELACRKADEQRERAEAAEERLKWARARVERMPRGPDKDELRWRLSSESSPRPAPDYAPEHLSGLRAACAELSWAHVRLCEQVNRLLPREPQCRPPLAKHPEEGRCAAPFAAGSPCWLEPGHSGAHEATPYRYPCSPTCTHDDAATPDHPERVMERSATFTQTCMDSGHTMTATGCGQCAPNATSFAVVQVREARSDEFTAKMAEHQETAEAVASAREDGMEAMRAACLSETERVFEEGGLRNTAIYTRLVAAIEGAAP
jgi:hypothetical protein